MTSTNIDPSCYIIKFGKYKNMLACDVVDIQTVNKQGQYETTGLKYLQWLTTCSWFKDTDLIKTIIVDYLEEQNVDMGDIEEKEPETKKTKTKVKKSELIVSHH